MNRESPIGVFDSGVGGLTVLRALHDRLPNERTVYLGDTARVPYGTKSPAVVERYALANARFLEAQGVKLLVVACNTASAESMPALAAALSIPSLGVIVPGARAAAARTKGRVLILGTPGTIASGAYQRALAAHAPGLEVVARACPLFVPLAEEGWTDGDVPRLVAERYLADLRGRVDTAVLGCTHYPLLAGASASVLGPDVALVDSAGAAAAAVASLLSERDLARTETSPPDRRYFVTDVPAAFERVAARFLGHAPERAEQVDILV